VLGDLHEDILGARHVVRGERFLGQSHCFGDRRIDFGAGRELGPGIYGLSNHLLDTPWPKVRNAKSRLSAALSNMADTAPVLALLRDDRPAPDAELPGTGVSLEWERLLSSAFVRAPEYGTRCSTVARIDRRGRAYFDEWSWDATGKEASRMSLQFELG